MEGRNHRIFATKTVESFTGWNLEFGVVCNAITIIRTRNNWLSKNNHALGGTLAWKLKEREQKKQWRKH